MVTASEIRLNPLSWQASDCEWITLIAAINVRGWLISPFFVFEAKNHQQAWYYNNLKDWRIAVSEKG